MAIKFYDIPEKGMTVGVLCNTAFDAINKIDKLLNGTAFYFCDSRYVMPDSFRAVAKVHGDDVYDQETGRQIVKDKLMEKYYKSFDAKIEMFKRDLLAVNEKVFGVAEKLENNT